MTLPFLNRKSAKLLELADGGGDGPNRATNGRASGGGEVRWIDDFKGLSLRSLNKLVIDEQTGSTSQLACDRPDKRELGKVTECQSDRV